MEPTYRVRNREIIFLPRKHNKNKTKQKHTKLNSTFQGKERAPSRPHTEHEIAKLLIFFAAKKISSFFGEQIHTKLNVIFQG